MRRYWAAVLVLIIGVVVSAPTPSSPGPRTNPCVFARQWGTSVACTPFKTVAIHVLNVFPNSAFGEDVLPEDVVPLDDGTILVHTQRNGLFRIVNGRITTVWRPHSACPPLANSTFRVEQGFDDELLGRFTALVRNVRTGFYEDGRSQLAAIRGDGSIAFRWPLAPATIDTIAKDASGVVWALNKGSPQALLAYFPRTNRLITVASPNDVNKIFRSPNGHVYLSNDAGLFVLESRPTVHVRMVHRAIGWSFQGVGRDGSLWVSTPFEVVHVHANGAIGRLQLRDTSPPMVISGGTIGWGRHNIDLTMTPDGAVWTTGAGVRIGNDDHITVVKQPENADHTDVRFGSDSTMWVVARDTRSSWGEPFGIVNFAPASIAHGNTWPFTDLSAPPPPTPSTPCPAPPTPFVPVPRHPAYYVYVVADAPATVWGYWASPDGRLNPVRGSPYSVGASSAESLTIDPSGRFLYVGSWYDGIFAYAIDAASGALRQVAGSPFASGNGPITVRIDPADQYAYADNLNGKTISVFSVNRATGALRSIAGSPFSMDDWPFRLTLNPKRNVAYVLFRSSFATYRAGAGDFHLISKINWNALLIHAREIFVDRSGRWAYLISERGGTITKYFIDSDGMVRFSGGSSVKVGNDARFLASDPRGRFLYVNNVSPANLFGFSIDRRNGDLSPIAGSPFNGADSPQELATTPDGSLLYASNFDSSSVVGFRVNPQSGALTRLSGASFRTGRFPWGVVTCKPIANRCAP